MAVGHSIVRSVRRPASSSLLTVGEASERYRVSKNTLRAWDNAGLITSYRAGDGSGWRRIDPRTVEEHLGLSSPEDKQEDAIPCCYCRVSSESQEKAQNRVRQEQRMRREVAAREGIRPQDVKLYSEVASSFGDRKALNRLMEDTICGKVSRIYVERNDRLGRVPSTSKLVESICRNRGVDIIVVEKEDTQDLVQLAMLELVKFSQVIGAKISGRVGAMATKRILTQEQLRDAYLMKKQGMSFQGIAREFGRRGEKDQRGKIIKGDSGRNLISRRLISQWDVLENTYGKDAKARNSFEVFCDEFVTISKPKGTGRKQMMARSILSKAYSQWCDENNQLEVSNSTISKVAAKKGWEKVYREGKHIYYVGMSVNTNQKNKTKRGL